MSTISQLDLNVRLQLAGCKYSDLANTYANNLKYRMKCASTNLGVLLLLNAYIEIIRCYKPIYDRSGIIENEVTNGAYFHTGYIWQIFADGVSISGEVTLSSNSISTGIAEIVAAVNSYQDIITANSTATPRKATLVRLITPCTNPVISIQVDTGLRPIPDPVVIPYTYLGECQVNDNCFTVEQLETMLDSLSKLSKICFQPIGFDYEVPEGYTLNDDGILIPD